MNYLRKYRNRFICNIELVSALDASSFLISPPNGFTEADVPGEYNGIYFTISSVELLQKSQHTTSGTVYDTSLKFNFPNFPGADSFQWKFSKLSEIRLTLNTGAVIRINRNDIAMNVPINAEFESSLKTVGFSARISQIFPLKIHEQ